SRLWMKIEAARASMVSCQRVLSGLAGASGVTGAAQPAPAWRRKATVKVTKRDCKCRMNRLLSQCGQSPPPPPQGAVQRSAEGDYRWSDPGWSPTALSLSRVTANFNIFEVTSAW